MAATSPVIFTYSMLRKFKNCRYKAKLRYEDWLVAKERDEALEIGTSFHEGVRLLRAGLPLRGEVRPLVRGMLRAYFTRWREDELRDLYRERVFEGPIYTGGTSKTPGMVLGVRLKGKIDRIVEKPDGSLWVVETKTASQIDDQYLQRLWTDDQIPLYVYAARKHLGLKVEGAIYDITRKCQLRQAEEESLEEFEGRRAELIFRSKSGKTTAKRRLGESDAEFEERVATWYSARLMEATTFRREEIVFSEERLWQFEDELCVLQDEYLRARRMGRFYQNTGHCFHFNKRCAYFALCRSGGNPVVIENFYERKPPHEELEEEKVETF